MTRDPVRPLGMRPWVRWCATVLALALVLVAIHQIVPHHPDHARCPVCTSQDRLSLAISDVPVPFPLPVAFRLPLEPAADRTLSSVSVLHPLRGPPPLLAV
jgi:hypothetical protein